MPDYGDLEGIVAMLDGGWSGSEGFKTILAGIGMSATIVEQGKRKAVEPWTAFRTKKSHEGFDVDFTQFATMEPIAFHRRHDSISNSAIYYGAWPNSVNEPLRENARGYVTGEIEPRVALRNVLSAAIPWEGENPKVHFWAEAHGVKDGASASCRVFSRQPWASNTNMRSTTTGVLALAAEKLALGRTGLSGLCTAGDVFSPEEIYEYLAASEAFDVVVEFFE